MLKYVIVTEKALLGMIRPNFTQLKNSMEKNLEKLGLIFFHKIRNLKGVVNQLLWK